MLDINALPERIQWHEGMLLGPQHFQQESARVDALVAWHALAGNPLAWGVRSLEIDESLLSTGVLRVLALEAVMPDGMAIVYSERDAGVGALELDLLPLAEQMALEEISIHLTVGRNRSMRTLEQPPRFRDAGAHAAEDEISEALPVDIPRMRPALVLAAGAVPPGQVSSLRLLSIEKHNEVFRRGAFVAAMLEVPPGSDVHDRATALAAQMRSKAAFLARRTAVTSSRLEDRVSLLEQRERLSHLSLMLPTLEAVLRLPGIAPQALYLALCAQVGSLAMLRPGAVPMQPPAWRHDDPMSALAPVLDYLETVAGEVSEDWRTHVFHFDSGAFSIDLQPEWLGTRMVLGLRGQPERELVAWMGGAVIGSRTVWTSLNDRRVLGAARTPIQEAPDLGLRTGSGYTLFSIAVTSEHIVADQALVVSNVNESNASLRPQEIVLFTKG
jgi:type VI secretion system protein ImpJ